jgi:hypothetical protein
VNAAWVCKLSQSLVSVTRSSQVVVQSLMETTSATYLLAHTQMVEMAKKEGR